MYKNHFGLKENPFNVNPDPRYLFVTRHIQEALACLTYGVQARKGFVLLSGDVGTGKTTLLNKVLELMRQDQIATGFVFNPRLNSFQFLDYMMADFGLNCETRMKSVVLARLNQWLLDRYRAGSTAVLIVDEAQDLSADVLEEIRLLTNLETSTEKLLQIILSGQPELELRLKEPQFRQIWQRITLRTKTHPLTLEETHQYIATRLRIAGSDGRPIFTPGAVEAAHRYAQGIPRVINILCEDSLISAFVDQKPMVPRETVEAVARELELDLITPTVPPRLERFQEEPGLPPGRRSAGTVVPAPVESANRWEPRSPELRLPEPPTPPKTHELADGVLRTQATGAAAAGGGPGPSRPPAPKVTPKVSSPAASTPPAPFVAPPSAPEERALTKPAEPSRGALDLREGQKNARVVSPPAVGADKVSPTAPPRSVSGEPPVSDDEIVRMLQPSSRAVESQPSRPPSTRHVFTAPPKGRSIPPMVWVSLGLFIATGLGGAYFYRERTRLAGTGSPFDSAVAPAPGPSSSSQQAQTLSVPGQPERGLTGSAAGAASSAPEETVASRSESKRPDAASPPARRAPARVAATSALPATAPKVGTLIITANVRGASITLDGRSVPGWETPYTFEDLPAGVHQVVVAKAGYESVAARLTVPPGETASFRAELVAPGGEINISTNPPGLAVSIDDGPFVPSPVQAVVGVGRHRYRIRLPDSRIYEGSFEMKNGSIITRRVDFMGGEWVTPEAAR